MSSSNGNAVDRAEVAIVGGGPAGLTSAVYLARFRRDTVVFDAADARAELIPQTRNCPGFPEGISGIELLDRLRRQATAFGAKIVRERVETIERREGGFIVRTRVGELRTSRLILATGIVDKTPAIRNLKEAIARRLVRLCPVCDAFEATDARIGVIGTDQAAFKEAKFLTHYTSRVAMLCNHPSAISEPLRASVAAARVELWDTVDKIQIGQSKVVTVMSDKTTRELDVVYPSMGCIVRSELALNLGARCDEEGYIAVGDHMQTSVSGVYAIGDVVKALNQVAVAFGHAALAATHIHNALLSAQD